MSKDLRGAETSQPTIRNSHLHSSGHWNSWYLAPPGSWAGPGTGKAGDHNDRRLHEDHLPVPAVISGYAKGVLEDVHSRLATSFFSFLTSVFIAHGFELAGQKYYYYIVFTLKWPRRNSASACAFLYSCEVYTNEVFNFYRIVKISGFYGDSLWPVIRSRHARLCDSKETAASYFMS